MSAVPVMDDPEVDWGSVEAELGALLPSAKEALPSVKCDYIKRDGKQCKQWAVRGASKCLSHGAQLPVVRRAAELRVLQARVLLMKNSGRVSQKLVDIALGKIDGLPHQVTAARAVLDRAGLTPVQRVESNVTVHMAADPVDDEIDSLIERRAGAIEVTAGEVVGSAVTAVTDDQEDG